MFNKETFFKRFKFIRYTKILDNNDICNATYTSVCFDFNINLLC